MSSQRKNYLRTWVEVNLENVKHNVKVIKSLLPKGCLFMAVVKANGYGHGAKQVAKAALEAGADRLGVATIEEAKELRTGGIKAPIHILTGFELDKASSLIKLNLIPSIYNEEQFATISKLNKRITVHIKVDTGMGRIGISPELLVPFVKKIKQNNNINIEGVFTHFATADEENSSYAKQQLKVFVNSIRSLAAEGFTFPINHAANSAATILNPATHFQMVRVGVSLYGLHPSEHTKSKINLKPALSWHSKLTYVKSMTAGQAVSYGATFKLKKDGIIGTVPVGYADGYSRSLSNNAEVLVNGKKVKQVGRVCMDQFMVDLDNLEAKPEDKVTLIGHQGREEITADDLAKKLNTINYEIVCGIASRVPRYYHSGDGSNP